MRLLQRGCHVRGHQDERGERGKPRLQGRRGPTARRESAAGLPLAAQGPAARRESAAGLPLAAWGPQRGVRAPQACPLAARGPTARRESAAGLLLAALRSAGCGLCAGSVAARTRPTSARTSHPVDLLGSQSRAATTAQATKGSATR